MRNRPHITWDAASLNEFDDAVGSTPEAPAVRLAILFAVLLLPLVGVSLRLGQLQSSLGERYEAAWSITTTHEEPLPCRDGRIIAADGQVFAEDRLRFDILVHYRWLEEPADSGWLRQQASSRLTRRERRDAEKQAAARSAVLSDRERLWNLLAATTGRTRQQLDAERAGVQRRIERMVESVTSRRDDRLTARQAAAESPVDLRRMATLDATPEDWRRIKGSIVSQLTTAPRRPSREPIVLQEELSHHAIITDVPLSNVTEIESAPSLFPGVRIQPATERLYPSEDVAAHIVGYRTEVTPEELGQVSDESRKTLVPGDRLGRTGIERAFDQTLRGRRGTLRIVKDRRGEIIAQSVVEQPAHGRDVVLTIDATLQRTAERLLDEAIGESSTGSPAQRRPQGGCLIALDVRTGDVVTAAAAPRFDLGLLLHPDPDEWRTATSDPRQPFFPRVTQMSVPPGSVFKILTSIALLESKLIDPNATYHCQGYLDRPDRNRCYIFRHYGIGHGDMTLMDAMCQSCNVYYFHAARSLGPGPILDWASRFGLGLPSGTEVPGERGGHLPQVDGKGKVVGEQWYNGSTLQLAIGQASLTVTPLQVARLVAAVANDGYLVTPRFVQRSPRGSSSLIERVSHAVDKDDDVPLSRISGLTPGTLATVREGMRLVVDHKRGTGKRVRIDGLPIAGKTGTAEVGNRKGDHAWFVGFVPADVPRYAFVVVLEHGGSGGSKAAPIAKQFIEAMVEQGLLTVSQDAE